MASSTQQLSSSCQRIFSDENVFSNTLANSQRVTTGTHYVKGTGSLGRLKYHQKHKSLDASDEELEYTQLSQSTHLLGRVKSERLLAFNSDAGNRRRRTIIVEKRNNSYGFTLQSYAIHYRRDPEFETITYVDYVEYDGPAYRAGMREGDVILSINGVDLEKADHKTLVAFIKSCDTRMRMVVLFEDCVRKVELHMRYIQLQTLLQNKLNELECIALRERELLDGKWKTHSLPVRKKTNTSPTHNDNLALDGAENAYYRPALSTEDVPNTARYYATPASIIPPPAQFRLMRHYRTPSSSQNSAEFADTQQRYVFKRADSTEEVKALARRNSLAKEKVTQEVDTNKQRTRGRVKSSSKHCHSHSCNPCIGHFRWKSAQKASAGAAAAANGNLNANNDNVSLDAYDLASPCCDTHCVPTRRRLQHKHMKSREHDCNASRSKERAARPKSQPNVETIQQQQQQQQQQKQQQQQSAHRHHHHHPHNHHHHHHHAQHHHHGQQQPQACGNTGNKTAQYIDLATGVISYCTLHQATTTTTTTTTPPPPPLPPPAPSADQTDKIFMRQQSQKSRSSYQEEAQTTTEQQTPPRPPPRSALYGGGIYQQRYHITATQIQPSQICINPLSNVGFVQKPRSWDNLTTKAIAMGYGYGYLDTTGGLGLQPTIKMQIQQQQQQQQTQQQQQRHSMPRKNPNGRFSAYAAAAAATNVENYAPPPSQFVGEFTTTTTTTILAKSTEHLITPTPIPTATPTPTPASNNTAQLLINIGGNNAGPNCGCSNNSVNNLKDQTQLNAFKTAQMQINQNKKMSHYNNCQLGYYSHLPPPTADVATSTTNVTNATETTGDITTVSEVTRL